MQLSRRSRFLALTFTSVSLSAAAGLKKKPESASEETRECNTDVVQLTATARSSIQFTDGWARCTRWDETRPSPIVVSSELIRDFNCYSEINCLILSEPLWLGNLLNNHQSVFFWITIWSRKQLQRISHSWWPRQRSVTAEQRNILECAWCLHDKGTTSFLIMFCLFGWLADRRFAFYYFFTVVSSSDQIHHSLYSAAFFIFSRLFFLILLLIYYISSHQNPCF